MLLLLCISCARIKSFTSHAPTRDDDDTTPHHLTVSHMPHAPLRCENERKNRVHVRAWEETETTNNHFCSHFITSSLPTTTGAPAYVQRMVLVHVTLHCTHVLTWQLKRDETRDAQRRRNAVQHTHEALLWMQFYANPYALFRTCACSRSATTKRTTSAKCKCSTSACLGTRVHIFTPTHTHRTCDFSPGVASRIRHGIW